MAAARLHRALSEIPADAWDALHDGRNPFVAHAFLAGLEAHGCLREAWGWTPCHLGLWDGDVLVAAAPGYLKSNSHGEFVFDHAWAQAHAQHGLEYFPKWLGAVPYSPVTGPRLLALEDGARRDLVAAIAGMVRASGLSSAHVNFHDGPDEAAFAHGQSPDDRNWSLREDIQYPLQGGASRLFRCWTGLHHLRLHPPRELDPSVHRLQPNIALGREATIPTPPTVHVRLKIPLIPLNTS